MGIMAWPLCVLVIGRDIPAVILEVSDQGAATGSVDVDTGKDFTGRLNARQNPDIGCALNGAAKALQQIGGASAGFQASMEAIMGM